MCVCPLMVWIPSGVHLTMDHAICIYVCIYIHTYIIYIYTVPLQTSRAETNLFVGGRDKGKGETRNGRVICYNKVYASNSSSSPPGEREFIQKVSRWQSRLKSSTAGKPPEMAFMTHTFRPLVDFWCSVKKCLGTWCSSHPCSMNHLCLPNRWRSGWMVLPTYRKPQGQVRQYTTWSLEQLGNSFIG